MEFFANKNIIITGAAQGVGKALTKMLKDTGANLILLDNDLHALNNLANKQSSTSSIQVFQVDLSDIPSLETHMNQIMIEFPSIDIFINNAGVSVIGPLEEQSMEDINWIININLTSAMELSRLILPIMKENKSGHLVFVGSAAGIQGFPNNTTYCASKFGLRGFAESLQTEVAPFGIRVTSVFPGPIKTNMLSRSRVTDSNQKNQIHQYLQTNGNTPEKVALRILRAIQKNKSVVLVSVQSKTLWFFKKLMPVSFTKLITRVQNKLPL